MPECASEEEMLAVARHASDIGVSHVFVAELRLPSHLDRNAADSVRSVFKAQFLESIHRGVTLPARGNRQTETLTAKARYSTKDPTVCLISCFLETVYVEHLVQGACMTALSKLTQLYGLRVGVSPHLYKVSGFDSVGKIDE